MGAHSMDSESTACVFPHGAWEVAEPASQGIDPRGLANAVEALAAGAGRDGVDELAVVRRGRLVWQGSAIDRVHGVWSLTKSFTSTILGLLIEDGKCALDSPAAQWVPDLAEHYPGVTLRHFATMTSGYRAVGDEPQGTYRHGPSLTPLTPDPEPLFAPGAAFAYWDSAMNQFAYGLTRIAEEPLDTLFRRRIADPIGMPPDAWRWDAFEGDDGLRIVGGAGNHVRLNITTRALARFGLLWLCDGVWEGRRLLGREWIRAATSVQVPVTLPVEGFIPEGPGVYGYNWWVNGIGPDGCRYWPGVPVTTFSASGYNNNDLFVIPEWDMVVVRLGLDEQDRQITTAAYAAFLRRIGDALI